jgi:hypothetical protein
MTLSCMEFIRRFQQHILPKRFTKVRTYGYLCIVLKDKKKKGKLKFF